jgi:putative phage-type endonuclease
MFDIIDEDDYDDVCELVESLYENYCDIYDIPKHSQLSSLSSDIKTKEEIDFLTKKIEDLKQVYQPKQKSKEWYQFRHELFTASNIWKIFGSESQRNSIIYDKCKPYDERSSYIYNSCNTFKWGNKYEPVSIQIYEKIYNTKVEDFGCIRHPTYNFIAASPDGINTYQNSQLFGRMVEVKNIVNRDITGYPKEEYWIQMQIQMETCNLDECDFIETRFKEFENVDDFYNNFEQIQERGIIITFVARYPRKNEIEYKYKYYSFNDLIGRTKCYDNKDIYLYKILVDNWIDTEKQELNEDYIFYSVEYWYLDEFSCILIKRNKKWFEKAITKIEDTWNIILHEKENGYEHRSTKNKKKIIMNNTENEDVHIFTNMPNVSNLCLIKIDENGIVS